MNGAGVSGKPILLASGPNQRTGRKSAGFQQSLQITDIHGPALSTRFQVIPFG